MNVIGSGYWEWVVIAWNSIADEFGSPAIYPSLEFSRFNA
jgi:hypothetical protein